MASTPYLKQRERQLEYAKEHREERRIAAKLWRDRQRQEARQELGIEKPHPQKRGKLIKLTWRYLGKSTRKERKEYLVNALGGKCEVCGYSKELTALHFDHKEPKEKHSNVSALLSGPLEMAAKEVKKCRLLCANCHAEKTAASGEWGPRNLDYIRRPDRSLPPHSP